MVCRYLWHDPTTIRPNGIDFTLTRPKLRIWQVIHGHVCHRENELALTLAALVSLSHPHGSERKDTVDHRGKFSYFLACMAQL